MWACFEMVPIEVTSATLKSLEDTLSPVELSPAWSLEPTLISPSLCLNVVHQVRPSSLTRCVTPYWSLSLVVIYLLRFVPTRLPLF